MLFDDNIMILDYNISHFKIKINLIKRLGFIFLVINIMKF